jgi:hypothetical protein
MTGHPGSAGGAYGWRDAWDTYDDPELGGVKKYELPRPDLLKADERLPYTVLNEGDRFWNADERWMLTVTAVRTKVYQGVVGGQGEEGDDYVFYTTDWEPRRVPSAFSEPHHPHRDDEPFFVSVGGFAELVAEGVFVPHTGNGIDPPP